MRSLFETQLEALNVSLLEMAALVQNAITRATDALIRQDAEAARAVMDSGVEDKEKEIEGLCLKLLLHQQPVAKDLRLISSALKMITDMERIGDQAADISELTVYLADKTYIKRLEHIPLMAEATVKMVIESIDAYVRKDLTMAHAVIDYDDVVDGLFLKVKSELIDLIRLDENAGEQAMDLLMIAKHYERIGDHAVNIAGWVVFSITGKHAKE
ncbi:MAG: phosphate signaling complex protein PhoU [Clostridia bacterium]|nr:phosphate signaling complex protein PhoU [Clostridia bacterium]